MNSPDEFKINNQRAQRIAIDGRFYRSSTGGIGRYSQELIKNLLAIDGDNQYFLFLTPADAEECQLYAPNLKKIVTPITHFTLAEQLKLGREIAEVKPDLTHFLNFNHPIFFRAFSDRPYITTVHDLTMNFFPVGRQQKSWLRRQIYLKVMDHACHDPEAIIVPTNTVKDDLIKHLKADTSKIKVIYEGASAPSGALARPKPEYLAKIGITKPYLLFVSQWRPHKGLAVLIEAFSLLKQDFPGLQLVITGKPSDQFPAIPKAIESSPFRQDIVTPGFVNDEVLASLYAGSELFIFPSWYEGFGLPPLEAMAHGTAVASSNTSVMPEILGDAAVYFNPRDPRSMAKTIKQTLNDPVKLAQLRALGKKQASKYSWRKMAQETLALYLAVIKGKNKR